jgi:hypothetical protein
MPAARAHSSMKHSMYTAFWLVLRAPRADGDVGVAHRVLDEQVRHGV